MRITGGVLSGFTVDCPDGVIRPAMDRMRESIFAILGDLSGKSFLDLFSGSGTIAIEAASRGAARVELCEKDKIKVPTILSNVNRAQSRLASTNNPSPNHPSKNSNSCNDADMASNKNMTSVSNTNILNKKNNTQDSKINLSCQDCDACAKNDKAAASGATCVAKDAAARITCHFMPAEYFVKRWKLLPASQGKISNQFDYIFLDPPFPYNFAMDLIGKIAQKKMLAPCGTLLLHHPREKHSLDNIGNFCKTDTREYGRSIVDFYCITKTN